MLEAIEHLNVGGPDAVRRAAESLALSATLYEADDEDHRAVYSRIRSLGHSGSSPGLLPGLTAFF